LVVVLSRLLVVLWTVYAVCGHDNEDITSSVENDVLNFLTQWRTEEDFAHVSHVALIDQLGGSQFIARAMHEVMLVRQCMFVRYKLATANHVHELVVLCFTVCFQDFLAVFYLVFK